jgi:hypothetical protein
LVEIPVPVRKSYTTRFAGVVVPGTVQAEVILSVVPEMNPVQLATFVFVDASLTFSVVKSFCAATHEPAPDKGAPVGQADTLGVMLL